MSAAALALVLAAARGAAGGELLGAEPALALALAGAAAPPGGLVPSAPARLKRRPRGANATTAAATVLYTRVPKCGSTTMKDLLGAAARENGYAFVDRPAKETLSLRLRARLDSILAELFELNGEGCARRHAPRRVVAVMHVYYVNIGAHWRADHSRGAACAARPPLPRPLLINMVREPVARYISGKYYSWFGPRPTAWMSEARRRARVQWGIPPTSKLTVDALVRHNPTCAMGTNRSDDATAVYTNMLVAFFCGFGPECRRVDGPAALLSAARALQHEYAFIGVTEAFGESVALLERTLPHILGTLSRVYERRKRAASAEGAPLAREKAGALKRPTSAATVAFLRTCLAQDVALYEFACRLFACRLRAAGVPLRAALPCAAGAGGAPLSCPPARVQLPGAEAGGGAGASGAHALRAEPAGAAAAAAEPAPPAGGAPAAPAGGAAIAAGLFARRAGGAGGGALARISAKAPPPRTTARPARPARAGGAR